HQVANSRSFGHASSFGIPDIDRTQTSIISGGNPMASNGSIWTVPDFRNRARESRQRGGTSIVVDPRRTETARVADRHSFIRPATDAFFLVASSKAVSARRPARPVQDFITGSADVAAASERFDAAACGAACGVSAEDIGGLAERMTQGPAVLYGRMGVATQAHGTLNAWSIGSINIAAGQSDREGGIVCPSRALDTSAISPPGSIGKHRSRVSGHRC
ncbi:hypothetical protein OY671_009285, partial [Metschnikowia pulcherrima]